MNKDQFKGVGSQAHDIPLNRELPPHVAAAVESWSGDESMEMTHAAAYTFPAKGWSGVRESPEIQEHADILASYARSTDPDSVTVYHGTGGRRNHAVGERFDIPLMATTPDPARANQWAGDPASNPKRSIYEFHGSRGVWAHPGEKIVSGSYKVEDVRDDRIVLSPHQFG